MKFKVDDIVYHKILKCKAKVIKVLRPNLIIVEYLEKIKNLYDGHIYDIGYKAQWGDIPRIKLAKEEEKESNLCQCSLNQLLQSGCTCGGI